VLNGTYQWTCNPKLVASRGSFELTVRVPAVEGFLVFDNFTRVASGTVNAGGEISVTSMDDIFLTGRVNPSPGVDRKNRLAGSGEIRTRSTAWGESYTCTGSWSAY
jgi:hypothetical protein